jgi:hypothetical protein
MPGRRGIAAPPASRPGRGLDPAPSQPSEAAACVSSAFSGPAASLGWLGAGSSPRPGREAGGAAIKAGVRTPHHASRSAPCAPSSRHRSAPPWHSAAPDAQTVPAAHRLSPRKPGYAHDRADPTLALYVGFIGVAGVGLSAAMPWHSAAPDAQTVPAAHRRRDHSSHPPGCRQATVLARTRATERSAPKMPMKRTLLPRWAGLGPGRVRGRVAVRRCPAARARRTVPGDSQDDPWSDAAGDFSLSVPRRGCTRRRP